MLNISQVIFMRTDSNLCRKEFTVLWSAPNSLIRSYLQPCTNSMWGNESEAVAPIIWLYQIVDAQKEEVFFPELLITLGSYVVVWFLMDGLAACVFCKKMTSTKQHMHPIGWSAEGFCAFALWCIMMYGSLRALVNLHCDVTVRTENIKTCCSCWLFKGDLKWLWKKIQHQNTM